MSRAKMRVLTILLITAIAVPANFGAAPAQTSDDLDALNQQVIKLHSEGKYAEATPFAERALAIAERLHGEAHPDTLASMSYLGWFYHVQGRYADAEPLYRRALEASERILGTEHPHTLLAVNNLAMLYSAQSRYAEAEPLHKRALETSERALGPGLPRIAIPVSKLESGAQVPAFALAGAKRRTARTLAARSFLGPADDIRARSVAGQYCNAGASARSGLEPRGAS